MMAFSLPLLVIPLFYAFCFGGLVYVLLLALQEGARHYDQQYAEETSRQFADLFLFIPSEKLAEATRLAAAVTFFLLFLVLADFADLQSLLPAFVVAAIPAVAVLYSPKLLVRYLWKRRREQFNNQLVEALGTMSNALRAGYSINQAFEAIVREGINPIAQEFGVFLQEIRVGVNFERALQNLEERVQSEDLTLMVRSIEIARQTGGNLTEVFDRIAHTIRERIRIQGRIRSMTAQGRLQGIVVGLLPILFLFVMLFLDPGMMQSFFSTTTGISTLVFVALLELAGFFVIRKIVNINV